MAIIARDNSEGTFEKIPTGNQQAVCVFVEDIGTQEGSYMGSPIKKHQIIICWELAEQMKEGENAGKPFMISKFYTLSLNEKANLCKDLESWRGKAFTPEEKEGFDVERLIGINCLLNIVMSKKQDGNEFAKIASISPLFKNMEKIKPINTIPPKWIQKKRELSIEWRAEHEGISSYDEGMPENDEEGLPF